MALFDFDGTMMKGDSIALLVWTMFRQGVLSPRAYLRILWDSLRWRLGLARVEDVKRLALLPLKALGPEKADEFLRRFVKEAVVPRLYPQAMERMRRHAAEGCVVLVVSASPASYLRHIRDYLPADAVIGTETDDDFRISANMTGEEKVRAVRQWLETRGVKPDWAASFAYGDSISDLPMLRLAGQGFLVNAKPKTLRRARGLQSLRWT